MNREIEKMDFLAPENDCGQSLLKLAAAGSTIIAELLRLSNHIPDVFTFESKKHDITEEEIKDKLGEKLKEQAKKEKKVKAKDKKNAAAAANEQAQMILEAQLREDTLKLQQFEQRKYERILFDMKYLLDQDYQDQCDERIQSNIELIDIDEQFKESYLEVIERFYTLFESIYQYYLEINDFIQRVRENFYIDFNMDGIMQEKEGKRLLIEAYYNYGVMLLLLDRLIPSIARERMMVCYVRYKSAFGSDNTTHVAKMCKNTGLGYDKKGVMKIPEKYPMDYFGRFGVDRILIENLINALKDDDVYGQLSAYPNPQHRSVALANQAQIIFVLLGFTPRVLDRENAKMREIADKHFPDNFVIQIYQGYLVDISQYWDPFPAARQAIANNINSGSVKSNADKYASGIKKCFDRLNNYLTDGQLLEDYVLDNVKDLLECLRDSNVTIRWLMLHTNCKSKEYKEIIEKAYDKTFLMNFILRLAKFESQFETMIRKLVSEKAQIWGDDRDTCYEYINEIAEFFSGNRQWAKEGTVENQQYADWFKLNADTIMTLDYKKSNKTGVKIQNLVQALEDIQVYDIIDTSVQIKHNIQETQKRLRHMVRIVSLKKQILINMSQISDFSYAWKAIDDFIPIIQQQISTKPDTVLLLKTVFSKLASIMNVPLKRIIEYSSEDMKPVAKYYSGELVKFVKKTLSIIPTNIFDKLQEISVILTKNVKEMETKMLKETLKDFACFEDRFILAKRTHEVSMLTEGMLVLDKSLMGVIEIDPKEILVDGIRKELGRTLAAMLHEGFIFQKKTLGEVESLESKFQMLREKFTGLKRSIEYIQDFLNIQGEQIWREELTRIIKYAVEKESTALVNKKYQADLDYEEKHYVPSFIPVDAYDFTFMGRLLRNITESLGKGMYLDSLSSWYDNNGQQIFGLRYVHFLHEHLGTTFLQGLDRLIVYTIVSETRKFQRDYGFIIGGGTVSEELRLKGKKHDQRLLQMLTQFDQDIGQNFQALSPQASRQYQMLARQIANVSQQFIPQIVKIGKLQLLRKLVVRQINFAAKVECAQYTNCLEAVNQSMLNNIVEIKETAQQKYVAELGDDYPDIIAILDQNDEGAPNDGDKPQLNPQQIVLKETQEELANKQLRELMKDMTQCLEFIGYVKPQNKVYSLTRDLHQLPLVFALVTLNALQYLQYDTFLCSLVKSKKEMILDGPHFITGLLTIFKQYHNSNFRRYLMFLANYFKNVVHAAQFQPQGMKALPPEVSPLLTYLEELMRFEGSSRDVITQIVGTYIFDYFIYRPV